MKEPFNRNEARKLIQEICATGIVESSRHAKEELAKDDLTMFDVRNVLRAGKILEEPELENGTWRYRVHTELMAVVVAFVSESKLKIVTAWRKKK
ncbi:hypothetical protein D187_002634 [Cystobacter fuscus DSM 2262]|uniref:DUF4258 domain-containing protein n=1 Tax=Cystobacter fuscus (strain ATCC 25194 / DSM 2262 / NBRC 100088 / M29) TaxID=1242864 RepID=S9P5Y7_CYSF2|nr:DUF4258 domain-containing protein [Cystobacter fuscus]EPX59890.1 hypothetical protein D187_002634 [Cystobacter fuscus DSM 2262]